MATADHEPVYADEIATLREMLAEERNMRDTMERRITEGHHVASNTWNANRYRLRIEALTTAIEALGGAL